MRIDEQLKIICLKADISLAELSRRLSKTPQAFSQKMKRGHFTVEELEDIALVSGCQLKCEFVYPNGEKITIV